MVYIHIPEALTEEEQMLMAKYAKLKKKVKLSENDFTNWQYFDFLEEATTGS